MSHGGRSEHLADEQERQPPRPLLHHGQERSSQIRSLEGFQPSELLDVLGRFRVDDIDHIIDGDDPLHPPLNVDNRERQHIVAGDQAGDRLLVGLLSDRHDIMVHHVLDEAASFSREQFSKRHNAQKLLLRVEHVDVVDQLHLVLGLAAHILDGLVDRDVGTHAGKARTHQPAGLVLGIGEQARHFLSRNHIKLIEQSGPVFRGDLLQDIGCFVRGQLAQPEPTLDRGKLQDDLRLAVSRQSVVETVRIVG